MPRVGQFGGADAQLGVDVRGERVVPDEFLGDLARGLRRSPIARDGTRSGPARLVDEGNWVWQATPATRVMRTLGASVVQL